MSCLRRSKENCNGCISSWANSILRDYDADSAPRVDYSMSARMMMVIDCLQKADTPLCSSAIDLKSYCTKQLKRWTLMKMIGLGYIRRRMRRAALGTGKTRRYYVYELTNKPFPASVRA